MLMEDALNELSSFAFRYTNSECDYSGYLKRAERLVSLAKEKKWQEKKTVMYLPESKAFKGLDMVSLAYLIGRRMLAGCDINIEGEKFDISGITKHIRPELLAGYKFRVPTESERDLYCRENKTAIREKILAVNADNRTWLMNTAERTRKSQIYRGWRWKVAHEKGYTYFHDASLFFGWLAIISEVSAYISSLEDAEDDIIYLLLKKSELKMAEDYKRRGYEVPEELAGWIAEQYGIEQMYIGKCGMIAGFPLYLVDSNDWGSLGMYVNGEAFAEAFCRLRLIEGQKKLQDEQARKLASDYAEVYVTKKNIPAKTVNAMSASALNHYFGYVEFDEDVDLTRVHEFEEDFAALQTILHQPCLKDYELRLRKLGRHRAAGLYFPTLRCLCVDLRMLWSTAHEYFHLLDYHYGNLSQKASFEPVYSRYSELLKRDREQISMICKGSKYNMDYYLMPTEVFARCAEMYLVRILTVENSLVEPDSKKSFAYPDDEELMENIKRYFGDVFIPKYCKEENYGI